jgi:glycosyltransferase involved in cell wall biosynthesis
MRVGFITEFDPKNKKEFRKAWSGIFWHMLREFERQGIKIKYLGPVNQDILAKLISKSIELINRLGIKPPIKALYNPYILKRMAKRAKQFIHNKKIDVILTQSSVIMAHFKSNIPIVYWRDANFADLYGTYEGYTNIHPISIKWAYEHEKIAMNNVTLNIFSSECSYKTATKVYNIHPSKVVVIPYGANHEYKLTKKDIQHFIKNRSKDRYHLLFIGKDWKRKGADIAIEICKLLNRRGIPTTLDIVGYNFETDSEIPPYVNTHGFIDKYSPKGRQKMRKLLENTHFLIHPARAEAYGCVLCEACSFGVPCITTSVGGIPTIIKNGKNGYLFPTDSSASLYADCIEKNFSNYEDYIKLAENSFKEYEKRLNWPIAVSRVIRLIQRIILKNKRSKLK